MADAVVIRAALGTEAMALLEKLCLDSLETPLFLVREHPEGGDISATFARLADVIEELA